ncbi:MAG: FHA domain-containing protein [Pseudomonadota bacterium]
MGSSTDGEVAMYAHWPNLIEIQYRDQDDEVHIHPGVVVDVREGYATVMTQVLGRRGVIRLITGETTLPGEVIRSDPERNLSLLRVAALDQEPVVLGRSQLGMQVLAVSLRGVSAGQVTGIRRDSDAVTSVIHSAGSQLSGVLVDECGQLVAVLPGQTGTGLDSDSVAAFLAASQVSVTRHGSCKTSLSSARLSLQEASERARLAQDQAEQANQAVSSLETRLRDSSRRNDELERRAREARVEADRAAREAAVARALVDDARAQFEQKTRDLENTTIARIDEVEAGRRAAEERLESALAAQAEASRHRDQLMILVAAALVLVSGAGTLVWLRARRVVPDSRNSSAPRRPEKSVGLAGAQDVLMEGRDDEGTRFRVRASLDRLQQPSGMVLGRNPRDSELVVEHPDVSRRHARIRIVGRELTIEDLGSTNGTSVNGRPIDKKRQVTLVEGDRVVLGSVRLNVGRA